MDFWISGNSRFKMRPRFSPEYFRQSGGFKNLSTLSVRGWPLPMDARDRYYPMIQHSDPVYAVWAVRP